jgi:carbonic anhydrase/acetyltransferase-like protein (isoleucine patch superfamily)
VRRQGDLLLYDVYSGDAQDRSLEELRSESTPAVVDLAWRTEHRDLPRLGEPPHAIDLPADGALAAHIEHWVHVLWTEPLLVPAVRAMREGRKRRARRATVPSIIGRGADIHPSAFIEGSVIGEKAVIGPCCSIRHSYVGRGSSLGDFTKLTHSVIGDETHTLADANFFCVVALGGGTLTSFLLKDTLLGKNVFLTSGVIFWNESLGEPIRVEHHSEWLDTGRKLLGGCAGHGSILGARAIIAPGRALPNRTMVVMRREEGVLRVEDAPPGTPMCWYDAALVPVDRAFPDGFGSPSERRGRASPPGQGVPSSRGQDAHEPGDQGPAKPRAS